MNPVPWYKVKGQGGDPARVACRTSCWRAICVGRAVHGDFIAIPGYQSWPDAMTARNPAASALLPTLLLVLLGRGPVMPECGASPSAAGAMAGMTMAPVGIALGAAGSPASIETADVALMADDLSRLPYFMQLARQARKTIRFNIALALGLKLVLVAGGRCSAWSVWPLW